MKWCEPHLVGLVWQTVHLPYHDQEDMTLFRPSSDPNSRMITVSDWLLDCVTDHKYYGPHNNNTTTPVVSCARVRVCACVCARVRVRVCVCVCVVVCVRL